MSVQKGFMKRKSLSDILLRLLFSGALVVGGILTLKHASAGAIVSCKSAKLQTVSCTITERLAFNQQIIEEKSIDGIINAKVATITATQSEGPDVEFFRVLGVNRKGVSYKIGQDEKDPMKAESVAEKINALIGNPSTSAVQFDYSSNLSNWFAWGAISLGIIISLLA
jgi:hypothetical protein